MLSELWGYLPYLFKGYGTFFKIIKGIWDTVIPLPGPHRYAVSHISVNVKRTVEKNNFKVIGTYGSPERIYPLFCIYQNLNTYIRMKIKTKISCLNDFSYSFLRHFMSFTRYKSH